MERRKWIQVNFSILEQNNFFPQWFECVLKDSNIGNQGKQEAKDTWVRGWKGMERETLKKSNENMGRSRGILKEDRKWRRKWVGEDQIAKVEIT